MSKIEVNDEIGTFRIIPDWVIDSRPSFAAMNLYLILKQYARNQGECYPSKRTLGTRLDLSERHITTLLNELESLGCITVETRSENGKSLSNLYRLPVQKGRGELQFRGEAQFHLGVKCTSEQGGSVLPTKEKTIKEKTLKEKNTRDGDKPSNDFEEFLSQVRAAYPKRNGNYEWTRFSQRAKTAFKSKLSREQFLDAVRNYAKSAPDPQFTKMPSSFIAAHHDYIKPTQEQVASSKVIEIEDWKEIGA